MSEIGEILVINESPRVVNPDEPNIVSKSQENLRINYQKSDNIDVVLVKESNNDLAMNICAIGVEDKIQKPQVSNEEQATSVIMCHNPKEVL